MNDIKFVKGDSEADAMLLSAVLWEMHEEVEKVVNKFSKLVPTGLNDQFLDYLCERTFMPTEPGVGSNYTGSPDLYGDEAYRDYVREVMGVKHE